MRQSIPGKLSLHQHILPFAFYLHSEVCIPFDNVQQFYDLQPFQMLSLTDPCTTVPLSHLGWQTLQGSQGLQCCFPLPRLLAGTDHRIIADLRGRPVSGVKPPKISQNLPRSKKPWGNHTSFHLIMSISCP